MIRKIFSRVKKNLWWVLLCLAFISWIVYVKWNCTLWKDQNCTGFVGKTVWDVLELLIIPATLAGMAIILDKRERKADREIAKDNQREAALQNYFDALTRLILDKNLRSSKDDADIRRIARTKTVTTVELLDNGRKSELLGFINGLGLISGDKGSKPIIRLSGIDLSNVNLIFVDFSGAELDWSHLEGAILFEVDLSGADLFTAQLEKINLECSKLTRTRFFNANLSKANLKGINADGAYFNGAILEGANLEKAWLTNAYLENANLKGANLKGANLEGTHLEGANFEDAIMPDGKKYDTKIHSIEYIAANWMKNDPPE